MPPFLRLHPSRRALPLRFELVVVRQTIVVPQRYRFRLVRQNDHLNQCRVFLLRYFLQYHLDGHCFLHLDLRPAVHRNQDHRLFGVQI